MPGTTLRRLLVVATAPCTGAAAEAVVREARDADEVIVVAPSPASPLNYWANDQRARERAQSRLDEAIAVLAEHGVAAHGEIGDDDPLQALDDAVVIHRPVAAVLVTPLEKESGWLEHGWVGAAQRRFAFPIEHVAVDDDGDVVDDAAALITPERKHPTRDAAIVSVLTLVASLSTAFWFIGPNLWDMPNWFIATWAVFADIGPKILLCWVIWKLYLGRRFGDRIEAPVMQ